VNYIDFRKHGAKTKNDKNRFKELIKITIKKRVLTFRHRASSI